MAGHTLLGRGEGKGEVEGGRVVGMVGDRVVGMVEDRVVGKVEDRVAGKGVVGSGVVVREPSGQCGMEESMEQGVEVEVVEGLGECGG